MGSNGMEEGVEKREICERMRLAARSIDVMGERQSKSINDLDNVPLRF